MPVKVMNKQLRQRQATRTLIFGPPGSFKTTSIVATSVYPLHIMSFPGELGWATIPDNVNGLTSMVWEEPPGDPVTADSMRRDVEDAVFQTIAGKNGPCQTLALEGIHQLYSVYLNSVTGGSYGRGEDFEAQRYGRSHQMFMSFLRRVLSSPVPYITVSCWSAPEADTPGSKSTHQWPDVPGRLAKMLLGMFSVCVFAKVTPPLLPGGAAKGEWIIKTDQEVGGSGVKIDPRLAAKLPARMPQNFKQLYQIVGAAEAELEGESGQDQPGVA